MDLYTDIAFSLSNSSFIFVFIFGGYMLNSGLSGYAKIARGFGYREVQRAGGAR